MNFVVCNVIRNLRNCACQAMMSVLFPAPDVKARKMNGSCRFSPRHPVAAHRKSSLPPVSQVAQHAAPLAVRLVLVDRFFDEIYSEAPHLVSLLKTNQFCVSRKKSKNAIVVGVRKIVDRVLCV